MQGIVTGHDPVTLSGAPCETEPAGSLRSVLRHPCVPGGTRGEPVIQPARADCGPRYCLGQLFVSVQHADVRRRKASDVRGRTLNVAIHGRSHLSWLSLFL